jgi:hypothetical protein
MLNCLRVTDVGWLPALIAPAKTYLAGSVPGPWLWSEKTLDAVGKNGVFKEINNLSEVGF